MRDAFLSLIESLLRPIGGPVGARLRAFWYRRRLGRCGRNPIIGPDVHLVGCRWMEWGDDIVIDAFSVLVAGPAKPSPLTKTIGLTGDAPASGQLVIGDRAHIGFGTIIQAHAGVRIGRDFTTSAGCRIYSRSNDPAQCRNGTRPGHDVAIGYVDAPCRIGDNVWLGLDCIMVGGSIGDDVFALPQSLLTGSFAANQRVGGNPARAMGPRFHD